MDWLCLENRISVVTGGGSGIGRAIALDLAGAGSSVAVLDIDREGRLATVGEIESLGKKAIAIECDTSDPDAVSNAAARVRDELGACEILVNNAGMLRAGPLSDLDYDAWNKVMSVNLNGYFLCARAFRPQLLENGGGSIIQIASIAASNAQANSGAYSAAKAGVVALTKQLAVEWGPDGIRSNAISPGMIRTPLSESFYKTPGVEERRAAAVPSRRVGVPQDIADVALFLASDRAGYVNGAELLVDGGFDCMLMGLVPRPGY